MIKKSLHKLFSQKIDDEPKVSRYIKKRESNLILRFLAEKFNIKISRYNKRKPAFPSRLWFKEKFRKQKS